MIYFINGVVFDESMNRTRYYINKKFLFDLPKPVSERILAWTQKHRKRFCYVEYADRIQCREDAHYTAYSADFSREVQQQAGGEFSGMTRLSPIAIIEIPVNHTVIEEYYFCGTPYITIYNNSGPTLKS